MEKNELRWEEGTPITAEKLDNMSAAIIAAYSPDNKPTPGAIGALSANADTTAKGKITSESGFSLNTAGQPEGGRRLGGRI